MHTWRMMMLTGSEKTDLGMGDIGYVVVGLGCSIKISTGNVCPKTLKPTLAGRLRFLPTKEQGEFLLQFYRDTAECQRRT